MKLFNASFVFDLPSGRASVAFRYPASGAYVEIDYDGKRTRFDNSKRHAKPCATHAIELIYRVIPRRTRTPTNWEQHREKNLPPLVRLFSPA